jgi:hypothetical protein
MPSPEDLIRAREATGDRIAFGLGSALTLSVAALVIYGIQTGMGTGTGRAEPPTVRSPTVEDRPMNRSLAVARSRTMDLEPTATGSIGQRAEAGEKARTAAAAQPDRNAARSYVVWKVSNGVALVEGPDGPREVVRGSILPGAGQVVSIERSGTGWMIVTTETVINAPVL